MQHHDLSVREVVVSTLGYRLSFGPAYDRKRVDDHDARGEDGHRPARIRLDEEQLTQRVHARGGDPEPARELAAAEQRARR